MGREFPPQEGGVWEGLCLSQKISIFFKFDRLESYISVHFHALSSVLDCGKTGLFVKFGTTLDWENWTILQIGIFDICPQKCAAPLNVASAVPPMGRKSYSTYSFLAETFGGVRQ